MQEMLAARWSRYLIYAILAVLPLERIPSLDITHPIHATVRLSQVAGLILILINVPFLWQKRRQLFANPWRWLVLFLGSLVIGTVLASDHKRAITVLTYTIFVALLAWVFAARYQRNELHRYLGILVISALIACAFGFYQFFGDLLGLPISATGLREAYTQAVFGFPRIQSTALEPLYFGDYLLIPTSMLVLLIASDNRRRWAWGALLPILTVIWLTVSRAAIVAALASLVIGLVVAWFRRRFVQALAIVAITVVSAGLAVGLIFVGSHYAKDKTTRTTTAIENFSKQTTNVSNGESSQGRAITRQLAIDAFKSHLFFGLGPGNFGTYAHMKRPDRFNDASIVNNEPLEILAETGIVGSVFFGLFCLTLFWLAMSSLSQYRPQLIWTMGAGLTTALIAIAMQYQTFSTLYITHIWVAIGLLTGIALTLRHERTSR